MARRNRAEKRVVKPDYKYNSKLISGFVNRLMKDGKKTTAASVLYKSLDLIGERSGKPGLDIFERAVKNATPLVEVRPRRVGGATYQVPLEVRSDRRQSLAIRWLVASARARSGKSMVEKLAAEFMDAANNQGATVKKREDTHRMAEANRAFAHYRW
ncbi:30S ribosomal protein S7 [Anaerolineales bacterium HSG24]|nr:30S ribosomal protein S7 [Anaerolineales bacterium HSG24]